MTLLEVGNLDGLIAFFAIIMFGPPVVLTIIGFVLRKKHPNGAKIAFILATVYLIAGLGICGSMLM